jgi:hypothetical protein
MEGLAFEPRERKNLEADQLGQENLSEFDKFIDDLEFPVSKEEMLDVAHLTDAPKEVLKILENLPERDYESPMDARQELERIGY